MKFPRMVFVVFCLLMLAVSSEAAEAGGGCGMCKRTWALQQPIPSQAEEIELIFGSNLDSQEGCHQGDLRGADLYRCVFNLKTRTARDLKRLTGDPMLAELSPSLSADGTMLAYNSSNLERRRQEKDRVEIIAADSGRSLASVEEARFPCLSPDGAKMAYSSDDRRNTRLFVLPLLRTDGIVRLGAPGDVMNQRYRSDRVFDPSFFPDGKRIAFHRQGPQGATGAAVSGIDGAGFTALSEMNGAAHVAVNPDGRTIVWSRASTGSLEFVQEKDGRWCAPEPLPVPTQSSEFVASDGRLGVSSTVAHTSLSWVAPDLLLVSSQGGDGAKGFTCSRLFLLKFVTWEEKPEIIDVSGPIENLAGKTGRDFCTGDGRKIK